MTKRKLQMTAFSRFFLFLIIFVPATFFGVSYIKGEDGIQTLKNMMGMETTESPQQSTSNTNSETFVNGEVKRLQDELKEKERRLKDLYQENELLKKQADDAKAELQEVKTQLEKIKKAFN
ncbi:MAG TPA: hypothetical protein ENJ53_03615 [Phaeodactylibacter sp.]|nr:hypothetical protein [Phaeodactylibacter sp.]